MTYLVFAVVLVGVLGLLNLLLTFGVIRRLRELQQPATAGYRHPTGGPNELGPMAPEGTSVGEFDVLTTEGENVSRTGLVGMDTVVGFFSPTCPPCREMLPQFVDAMRSTSRSRVLAIVVVGDEGDGGMVAALSPVARVVVEQQNGDVSRAFQVSGYPAHCRVDENGVIGPVNLKEMAVAVAA